MFIKKNSQSMPLNIIIIAAILLFVLIVVIAIFRGGIGTATGDLQKCVTRGGTCASISDCAAKGKQIDGGGCKNKGEVCCIIIPV